MKQETERVSWSDILPASMRAMLRPLEESALFHPVGFVFRLSYLLYKELRDDLAFVRAAGMAYASLIAVVPMLVLIFGVLGNLGVLQNAAEQEAVYDALFGTFFGDVVEIRDALTPFLNNIDFRALGAFSTLALMVVAARLYLMVEIAYSDIFEVKMNRSISRRVLNFYFAATAVPLVMVLSLEGVWRFGYQSYQTLLVSLVQLVLLFGALKFFPCTPVRFGPAFAGAVVSGFLLKVGGLFFTWFISFSYANPDYPLRAFYGSLILVPIILVWLYTFWIIVLLGVEVAHVSQNYGSLLDAEIEAAERERGLRTANLNDAFGVLAHVAVRFEAGQGASDSSTLAKQLGLHGRDVVDIAEALVSVGLLSTNDVGAWMLARPASAIQLQDVAERWRGLTRLSATIDPIEQDVFSGFRLEGTLADALPRWLP